MQKNNSCVEKWQFVLLGKCLECLIDFVIRVTEYFYGDFCNICTVDMVLLCSIKITYRDMGNIRKVSLADVEVSEKAIYNNGELALFDNLTDIASVFPLKTEIYVIVLVLEGKVSVQINGTEYEARKNDIFICLPDNIIENGMVSIDFKCNMIGVSPAYQQRVTPVSENLWDMKAFFEKNPKCTLQPAEATIFSQYYNLLCSKINLPTPVQGKVIDMLILAFFYDMQYVLNRVVQVDPRPYSSGESLFKRFVRMVESSNPIYQSVTHYAECLCVTPKYLSSVCKQASGLTASGIIDKYVVKQIEYMMLHTDKSIKEIAAEMNFSNISFFGKYVKKHLGASPRDYRAKIQKNM